MPVYDKPMIYYPLSTLMLAGIKEILIITTPNDSEDFQTLFGDGTNLGITIQYEIQPKPDGLAQAFIIGESFIGEESVALILGDNIFYGPGLGRRLSGISKTDGATIFGVKVSDPQRYGVVERSSDGQILSIEEKPSIPKSNIAVPGLYFFDNTVSKRAKNVTKSLRGELEITSVLESYLNEKKLSLRMFEENTAWMDCGTVDSLNEAANFVKDVEKNLNFKIGCVEQIALDAGWLTIDQYINLAHSLGVNEYTEYLLQKSGH